MTTITDVPIEHIACVLRLHSVHLSDAQTAGPSNFVVRIPTSTVPLQVLLDFSKSLLENAGIIT
jgi:hypothetical protein